MKRFGLEQSLMRKGYELVVGCDEAGRGALAGPVVAAAVIFEKPVREKWWEKINDSKKLSPIIRSQLYSQILENASGFGIAEVGPKVIDEINIHQSTLRAMRDAVRKSLVSLTGETTILVDGKFEVPTFNCYQQTIIGGDGIVHSIGAASIVAKVYRDRLMCNMDEEYPEYVFSQHKGYGTLQHRKAISKHGLAPMHRVSFCGNIV